MNFSNDLWNNYDIVHNRFQARLKEIKDIMKLLIMKYENELDYGKAMKKISETSISSLDDSSLTKAINLLKTDLSNQYTYIEDFCLSIKGEVIDLIKNFINKQTSIGSRLQEEMKLNEKNYKSALEKTEKLKKNYHSLAKTAEELKIKHDHAKNNLDLTSEQKNKFGFKYDAAFNEQKDAEISYTHQLSFASNMRNNYIEVIKNILNEYQNLEEEYIDFVKDILRKYNIFQIPLSSNVQYDIDRKGKIIESIDKKNILENFIKKHSNPVTFPDKIQFQPYLSLNNKQVKPEVLNEDHSNDQTFKEIKEIVANAWTGNPISKETKSNFTKWISNQKNRKQFFNCLNNYRISNNFLLTEESFTYVNELLLSVIDELFLMNDYENFRMCLILSETFYKSSGINNTKVYLSSSIELNKVFKDLNFWEELIKYSINEELNNQCLSVKNEDPQNMNENTIIFGQLVSFTFQILTFNVPNNKTKELIEKFIKFHNISDDLKEELYKQIDNYKRGLPLVSNKNIESVNTNYNTSNDKKENDEEEIVIID